MIEVSKKIYETFDYLFSQKERTWVDIKHRKLEDEHYKKLLIEYLKKFGKSHRKDIEKFLWDKLPDILTVAQKKNKIGNLLSALRIDEEIRNTGYSEWSLI